MKKLLCVILCFLMLISLCSCSIFFKRLEAVKDLLPGGAEKDESQDNSSLGGGISVFPFDTEENGDFSVIIGGLGRPNNDSAHRGENGECFHDWEEATCTDPARCRLCGEETGEPFGCSFGVPASCTDSPRCERCGALSDEAPLGHDWEEASCENDTYCRRCGEWGGSALGHAGGFPSCWEKACCDRCGSYYGELLDHNFSSLTCEQDRRCMQCGYVEEYASGHSYSDGHCTECGRRDPDYVLEQPSANVKVSAFAPYYPYLIPGGYIQGATFSVSGNDIVVNMTVKKSGGDGSLAFGWVLYGSGYDILQQGSENVGYLSSGSTASYSFTIYNAIISEHSNYKVHLGYDQY